MAVVIVPTDWLSSVGGARRLKIEASTVGDLIRLLVQQYPDLAPWFDNGLGGLPEFMNVFVGEEDIRVRENLTTSLSSTDVVRFIPIMSGGD